MNFVAQVEDHLRDLGAEARKAHPGKCVIFPSLSPYLYLSWFKSAHLNFIAMITMNRCQRGIRASDYQPSLSSNSICGSGPSF